jgi:tetratricopeptide (TPR) repeat protein
VLEERVEVDLARGRYADCVIELSGLVAAHPLREPLHRMLMLALYRSGRQADALNAFHAARQILVDELGIEPGEQLRQLYQQILTGDLPMAAVSVLGPARGWPVPQQLPRDVPDFAGRQDEIRALAEQLGRQDTVSVCVISGLGGIGKTTLAVHLAHAVREQFPDGQLFVTAAGHTPDQILGRLLTDLGTPQESLPDDTDQRAALLRTVLNGRRVLLVLDGVTDSVPIQPLLPGSPGCAVLVTSRMELADLPGTHTVRLAALDDDAARRLFTRIVGEERTAAESEAVARVLRLCEGNPTAVRTAAVRLANRPLRTIGSYADRLAVEHARLDELGTGTLEVRTGFLGSYDELTTETAEAFRLLGVMAGERISPSVVAAMLAITELEAERRLDMLAGAHLLETTATGGYRVPELIRLFARERAEREHKPPLLAAALGRTVDFYRMAAYETDLLLRPGRAAETPANRAHMPFRGVDEAVVWWEAEHKGLVEVTLAAARLPEISAQQLATVLTDHRGFLHRRGHWTDWLRLAEAIAGKARQAGDQRAEATALLEVGTAVAVHRRFDDAERDLRESIRLFTAVNDELGRARALNNLAVVCLSRGAYRASRQALRTCLRVQRASGDIDGEAITLDNLALSHSGERDYDQAEACCRRSIRLRGATGTPSLSSAALNILGLTQSARGQHADAIRSQCRSLELARSDGNRYREAITLVDLGSALMTAGDLSRAVDTVEAALVLRREQGDRHGQADALRALGRTLRKLGEHGRAAQCIEEADALVAAVG